MPNTYRMIAQAVDTLAGPYSVLSTDPATSTYQIIINLAHNTRQSEECGDSGSRPGSEMTLAQDSACSRAIQSYDILWKILKDNYSPSGASSQSLCSADLSRYARVSRAIHEPAIHTLWGEQRSLKPLWSILAPPDLHATVKSAWNADEFLRRVCVTRV